MQGGVQRIFARTYMVGRTAVLERNLTLVPEPDPATPISGAFHYCYLLETQADELTLVQRRQRTLLPGRHFLLYLPPWSLAKFTLRTATSQGLRITTLFLPAGDSRPLSAEPVACCLPAPLESVSFAAFATALAGQPTHSWGWSESRSAVTRQVKASIERTYEHAEAIGAIAGRLGMPAEYMSRYVGAELGVSAVRYRTGLRSILAMYRLIGGEPCSRVWRSVGFGSRERFSKQFARYSLVPPGSIAAAAAHGLRPGTRSP